MNLFYCIVFSNCKYMFTLMIVYIDILFDMYNAQCALFVNFEILPYLKFSLT